MISNEQFIELINKPENGAAIKFMQRHEALIAAFSTGEGFDELLSSYADRYVSELRPTIKTLFKAHTKKLLAPYTGSVHSHFLKIYDSFEKRSVEINFANQDLHNDFFEFLRNAYLGDIGALKFSKEYLTTDILYNPNTRYYVDFRDSEGTSKIGLSEPVIKRIDCGFIHDVKEENGATRYIIFFENRKDVGGVKEYFLIDDTRLIKAVKKASRWVVDKDSEVLHEYGYTPVCAASNARRFIKGREEIKKSVISDSTDDIEAWLLTKNQDKVFFWRNQTPREYSVSSQCKGTIENGVHYECNDGFIDFPKKLIDDYGESYTGSESRPCVGCDRRNKEKNKFGGNVSVAYEDLTRNSDKIQKIKEGFGFISTDPVMLDASKKRIEDDLAAIEVSIIGRASNGNVIKEAINEKQVKQNGESKEQTLTSFSEQVEAKEMFLFDLLGKGRYKDAYSYTSVYLGRRWVFSNQDISSELRQLKESNASIVLIKRKEEELIRSSYSYDKDFQTIIQLANALIPFQGVEISTLITNSERYIARSDEVSFQFRIHVDKLLAYLEAEFKSNINLQLMPFEKQVEAVYKLFISYLHKLK